MLPGPTQLALVLVIILILFGAGKLPEVLQSLGEGIKKFREAQGDGGSDARDVTQPPPQLAEKAGVSEAEEVKAKQTGQA